jgi:hypothetical protein
MPEPVEIHLTSFMGMGGSIPVSLWVFDLELLEMVTPDFLRCLGKSPDGLERGILPPDGHVMTYGG